MKTKSKLNQFNDFKQYEVVVDGHLIRQIMADMNSHFYIAQIKLTETGLEDLMAVIQNDGELSKHYQSLTFQGSSNHKNLKKGLLTIKGTSEYFIQMAQNIDKDLTYTFYGKLIYDEKYQSFQIDNRIFLEQLPTTPEVMIAFLAKNISTIGKAKAKKIVDTFGIDQIENLFSDMKNIVQLKKCGVPEKDLILIHNDWKRNRLMFKIINYLKEFDLTDSIALSIYNVYKDKSMNIIMNQPYELTKISGISFLEADRIARGQGIDIKNSTRIGYGIKYVIENLMQRRGDSLIELNKVLDEASKLLGISLQLTKGYIEKYVETGKIHKKVYDDVAYVTTLSMYELEKSISQKIIELVNQNNYRQIFPEYAIKEFVEKNEFNLDESQLKAAENIFRNNISILTGGPGTGKTTTIRAIVSMYEKFYTTISLTAPTGKAAQKISQSTNREALTLHRYLELTPDDNVNIKNKRNNDFLMSDLIIVDESSMLELYVVYQLLKRIDVRNTSIIFVGDIDQLPPVGVGAFFRDIVNSQYISCSKLTTIHRTSEDSTIAINAHKLNNFEAMDLRTTSDFEYIKTENDDETEKIIINRFEELLDEGNHVLDVQVISPFRAKTQLGCRELNQKIRMIANKNVEFASENNLRNEFLVGDKVMQQENNPQLKVFNGDTGMVSDKGKINTSKYTLKVMMGHPDYQLSEFKYGQDDVNELELAYAITIHKSQGSDYPYVLIPLSESHINMWNVSLLYTAITRTKTKVILVGSEKVLNSVYKSYKNRERITSLGKILAENKKQLLFSTKKQNSDDNVVYDVYDELQKNLPFQRT